MGFTRRDRGGGGDHLRVADLPRTLNHLGGGESLLSKRRDSSQSVGAGLQRASRAQQVFLGALSCLASEPKPKLEFGRRRRLRDFGDLVPREPSRSLARDAEEWSGVDRVGQDRSQTITGTSGTTVPPRLAGHLVRKSGKGMDERARGAEAEQATLAVVVGFDTRLRQCPSDLPCLVGRYDLTSVAAGQPL
jgi:hypothetical protein